MFCTLLCEKKVHLHGFADSSGVAYSTVIYVKVMCGDGLGCSLWTARSRLVPTKDSSMSRLELLILFVVVGVNGYG